MLHLVVDKTVIKLLLLGGMLRGDFWSGNLQACDGAHPDACRKYLGVCTRHTVLIGLWQHKVGLLLLDFP